MSQDKSFFDKTRELATNHTAEEIYGLQKLRSLFDILNTYSKLLRPRRLYSPELPLRIMNSPSASPGSSHRPRIIRRATATSLLASFLEKRSRSDTIPGPVNSTVAVQSPETPGGPNRLEILDSPPPTWHTPPSAKRAEVIDLDSEQTPGSIQSWNPHSSVSDQERNTSPTQTRFTTRRSSARVSLLKTSGTNPSRAPRAIVCSDIPKKKSIAKARSKQKKPLTSRQSVRHFIATETTARRGTFFKAKKELFLPLLPESNHVQKLLEKDTSSESHGSDETREEKEIFPFEMVNEQPIGLTKIRRYHSVRATMKPYQLTGLSFLLFLHKNGLSGILGDEMGLGKTLQTLSLFQHLKNSETAPSQNGQARPFLVVCPLSVLSSWMNEAQRWTPGLKVLKIHGPLVERNRMKKVVEGKEDPFGHKVPQSKGRKARRSTWNNNPVISLDSDSEPESSKTSVPDVVVTTYDTFKAEENWFRRSFVWRYIVLDEGHMIKNEETDLSKALQGLSSEYRLMLTGTPIQNNLNELWALLHWLYPEVFTQKTKELFTSSFDLSKGKANTTVMDDARRLLELIMLRRMKNSAGVNLGLPPKTEILLYIPLAPLQRFWYTRLLTRVDQSTLEELFQGIKEKEHAAIKKEKAETKDWEQKELEELADLTTTNADDPRASGWEESKEILMQTIQEENADQTKRSAWQKLMNLLMQLRKCCNHPYILPHAEPEESVSGEHFIQASGKFIVLDKLIQELVIKQKKKILMFSTFTRMLDCCEDFLAMKSETGMFKYCRIDGSTNRARRNLSIRMFNDKASDYQVMLVSTKAGGLGLNLAAATEVVMLDQDWNPQVTLQAEARAHRIGQQNPVTVYKLCTQGTVEEQMLGRIQKKLYLSAKVTESMRDIHTSNRGKSKKGGKASVEEEMPQLGTGELKSLMRRGAQTLTRPEIDVNEMINWDWETMLEKCKDNPASLLNATKKEDPDHDQEKEMEEEQRWLSEMEKVETRIFDGKKFNKEKGLLTNGDVQKEISRKDRRAGKNTTVMVDGYAISKESLRCGDWEAVPTFAGKDPRLADVKREKRRKIEHQDHCQVCWKGGDLYCCFGCPRAYHQDCLDEDFQPRTLSSQFYCPQHQCATCGEKSANVGGMIFRCRWCDDGYCEDCMDWEHTDLIGESLEEFELLGFAAVSQAFYVRCAGCHEIHAKNPTTRKLCEEYAAGQRKQWQDMIAKQLPEIHEPSPPQLQSSSAASLTDGTTNSSGSGLCTPRGGFEPIACIPGGGFEQPGSSMKRKVSLDFEEIPAPKRASGVA
ncbi:MAG: hypothetical protein M1837_007086 [Sclerophora amabilis]|nr:MAG: hypothetical protein M1837_007086 [Sclerophora amabilis]